MVLKREIKILERQNAPFSAPGRPKPGWGLEPEGKSRVCDEGLTARERLSIIEVSGLSMMSRVFLIEVEKGGEYVRPN